MSVGSNSLAIEWNEKEWTRSTTQFVIFNAGLSSLHRVNLQIAIFTPHICLQKMITGILLLLPVVCALFLLFPDERWKKVIAMSGSLLGALIALYGLFLFTTKCNCQLLLYLGTFTNLGISLRFGLDGITLSLVILVAVLFPLFIFSLIQQDRQYSSASWALAMLAETGLIGMLSSFDGLLFFLFWELTFASGFIITLSERKNQQKKLRRNIFVSLWICSGLLMLTAFLFLYLRNPSHSSFDIFSMIESAGPLKIRKIFLFLFAAGLLTKIGAAAVLSLDRNESSDTRSPGLLLLAGITLPVVICGFLRYIVPICHSILRDAGMILMILTITGSFFFLMMNLKRKDVTGLIVILAFSGVGMIIPGFFTLNGTGIRGAVVQMISLGINVTGLFLVLGHLQKNTGTDENSGTNDIFRKDPFAATCCIIFLCGIIGAPLTGGFIGKLLILSGLIRFNAWVAVFAGFLFLLEIIYTIRITLLIFKSKNEQTKPGLIKWSRALRIILILPAIASILLGVFPGILFQLVDPAIKELLYLISG
jgi:NADH-quinone oxidoreductase subunit M